jgi:small subunit ribosomal protein S6
MKNYEAIYILKPNSEEEEKEEVLNKVKDIISESGEIENIDEWGNKRLAYEIKNFSEGYYTVINYNGVHKTNQKLDKLFKISDSVIRSMIVKIEE